MCDTPQTWVPRAAGTTTVPLAYVAMSLTDLCTCPIWVPFQQTCDLFAVSPSHTTRHHCAIPHKSHLQQTSVPPQCRTQECHNGGFWMAYPFVSFVSKQQVFGGCWAIADSQIKMSAMQCNVSSVTHVDLNHWTENVFRVLVLFAIPAQNVAWSTYPTMWKSCQTFPAAAQCTKVCTQGSIYKDGLRLSEPKSVQNHQMCLQSETIEVSRIGVWWGAIFSLPFFACQNDLLIVPQIFLCYGESGLTLNGETVALFDKTCSLVTNAKELETKQ